MSLSLIHIFACVDGPEFDGHQVDFDQAMKRQAQYKTEEGRAMLKPVSYTHLVSVPAILRMSVRQHVT